MRSSRPSLVALSAFVVALFSSASAYAETLELGGSVTIEQEVARDRNVTLRLRAGQFAIVTVDGGNIATERAITAYVGRNAVASMSNRSDTGALPRQGPVRIALAASRNTSYRLAVYTNARVATVSAAPATSTADVTPTPIQIGSAVYGQIDWNDAWTPENNGATGDVYVFQGEAGQQIHLVARAMGVRPVLVLTGANFSARSEPDNNGDAPDYDRRPRDNARLRATLPTAGEYRLVVTRTPESHLTEGAYALRLTIDDMPIERRETAHAQYLQAIARVGEAADAVRLAQLARIPDLMREGERLLNSGNNDRALQIYRAINEIDRENVAAAINEAIATARLGLYGADWTLESLLRDHPNDAYTPLIRSNLEYVHAVYSQRRATYAAEQQAYRDSWTGAVTGGFIAGYNAGQAMEAERLRQQAAQAQAQAAAQAQAQAAAQARARAQQQASSAPSQQTASTAPSTGSDAQTGASIFLNPQTGRPCVTPVRTYTENRSGGDMDYYWVFRNTCDRTFRVFTVRQVVDPSYSPHQSMGLYPNSEASMVCIYRTNNLRQSCRGFVSYEVR